MLDGIRLTQESYFMISTFPARRIGAVLLLMLAFAGCALAQSDSDADAGPAANPGRPTVSTPATLTPVGYLQFETGVLGAQRSGEFADRTAVNEVIKFAPFTRLQFLVQTEPFVVSDLGDHNAHDPGGISLGAQAVLLPGKGHRPTIAVSYFRSIYGGTSPDLDIGSSRNSALILFSTDLGKFHIDTNYFFNEQIDQAVHRGQFGQTLSISHPVKGKLGFGGEIWHFTQPFLKSNAAGLLVSPTWTVRPNLVLDAGFNRGLTNTSTRWEFFAGFTYLLPRKLKLTAN
jgi:hypothetical protein